eukprot:CAMPEP_0118987594 /NCGR_PEP_ID=MMETSP1173-20130426/44478_1 /TAXON_ID=1034831 /ORGANISM="Rhizochromulina marina cf, Strain CCMP1243" /LENGTH=61 /DNA_ID=CAMNT_0006938451 /DNA_START=25 /DNA_END=207 /DNA_ORIENTATION=-
MVSEWQRGLCALLPGPGGKSPPPALPAAPPPPLPLGQEWDVAVAEGTQSRCRIQEERGTQV